MDTLLELSKDKELMEVCKKITGNSYLWKDLYQDMLLIIYEKPKEVMEDVVKNGKLKAFAIKVMLQQWSHKRTEFFKENRIEGVEWTSNMTPIPTPFQEEIPKSLNQWVYTSTNADPSITTNINYWKDIIKDRKYNVTEINPKSIRVVKVLEQIRVEEAQVGSGFHYSTEVFNLYLKLRSVRKVANQTGIDHMSIQRTVSYVKQLIREAK